MRIFDGKTYRDMTQEELIRREDERRRHEAYEAHRALMEKEVLDLILSRQVNEMEIDDQISLRMTAYYPAFESLIGQTINPGFKLTYGGKLYKTAQTVVVQEIYLPGAAGTESLYTRIDAAHLGTRYDPIPYESGMELYCGRIYEQAGILYACLRDTGAPVFSALSELTDVYVKPLDA